MRSQLLTVYRWTWQRLVGNRARSYLIQVRVVGCFEARASGLTWVFVLQSIAALEYFDQEATTLKEAFSAKNANMLLV